MASIMPVLYTIGSNPEDLVFVKVQNNGEPRESMVDTGVTRNFISID